jgi:hypothetical protein
MKYLYIAGAIENGKVKVTVGPTSVPGRDGEYVPQNFRSNANTLIFPIDNPTDETIVHEATHAVIDGTTVGSNISNISDEVAAYVAEMVYSLNKGRNVNQVGPVAGPLFELAQSVKNNLSGSAIALAPATVQRLKTALKGAYPDVSYRADGLGDGPVKPPLQPDP